MWASFQNAAALATAQIDRATKLLEELGGEDGEDGERQEQTPEPELHHEEDIDNVTTEPINHSLATNDENLSFTLASSSYDTKAVKEIDSKRPKDPSKSNTKKQVKKIQPKEEEVVWDDFDSLGDEREENNISSIALVPPSPEKSVVEDMSSHIQNHFDHLLDNRTEANEDSFFSFNPDMIMDAKALDEAMVKLHSSEASNTRLMEELEHVQHENIQLNETIHEYSILLQRLQEDFCRSGEEIESLTTSKAALQSRVSELEEKVVIYENSTINQMHQWKAMVDELEGRLANSQQRCENLMDSMTEADNQLEDLAASHKMQLQEQQLKYEREIEQLQRQAKAAGQAVALQGKLTEVKEFKENLKGEVQQSLQLMTAEMNESMKDVAKAIVAMQTLTNRQQAATQDSLQKELLTLQSDNERLQLELSQANDAANQSARTLEQLQLQYLGEMTVSQQQVAIATKKKSELAEQLTAVEREMAAKDAVLESLRSQLRELEASLASLRSEEASHAAANESLQQLQSNLSTELSQLQHSHSLAEETIRSLTATVAAKEAQSKELSLQIDQLNRRLADSQSAAAATAAAAAVITSPAGKEKKKKGKQGKEATGGSERYDDLVMEQLALQQSYEASQSSLQALQQQLSELQDSYQRQCSDCERVSAALDSSQSTVTVITAERDSLLAKQAENGQSASRLSAQQALQQQLSELQARYDEQQTSGEVTTAQLSHIFAERDSLLVRLAQLQASVDQLSEKEQSALHALQQQLSELQGSYQRQCSDCETLTAERNRLSAALDSSQSTVAEISAERDSLLVRLAQMQSDVDQLSENEQLSAQASQSAQQALQQQLSELQARYDDSQSAEEATATQLSHISAERDSLLVRLAQLQTSVDQLSANSDSSLAKAVEEIQSLRAALSTEQSVAASLRGQLEESLAAGAEKEDCIAAIQSGADQLEGQLVLLSQQLAASQGQIQQLSTDCSIANDGNRRLAATLQQLREDHQAELTTLQEERAAVQRKLSIVEESLRVISSEKASEESRNCELMAAKTELMTQLSAAEESISQLSRELSRVQEELSAVESERDALFQASQLSHETYQAQFETVETTLKQVVSERERYRQRVDGMEAEKAELLLRVAEKDRLAERAERKVTEATEEMQSLYEDNGRLTEQLRAAAAERERLLGQLEQLSSTAAEESMETTQRQSLLQQQLSELTGRCGQLSAEKERLTGQLGESNGLLAALQESHRTLQTDKSSLSQRVEELETMVTSLSQSNAQQFTLLAQADEERVQSTELRQRFAVLESKYAEQLRENKQLRDSSAGMASSLRELEQRLLSASSANETQQSQQSTQIQSLETQLASVSHQRQLLEGQLLERQSQLDEIHSQHEQLTRECQSHQEKKRRDLENLKKYNERIHELTKEKSELEGTVQQLSGQVNHLQAVVSSLSHQLHAATVSTDTTTGGGTGGMEEEQPSMMSLDESFQTTHLPTSLHNDEEWNSLQQLYESLQESHDRLSKENSQLTQQLKEMTGKCKSLEEAIAIQRKSGVTEQSNDMSTRVLQAKLLQAELQIGNLDEERQRLERDLKYLERSLAKEDSSSDSRPRQRLDTASYNNFLDIESATDECDMSADMEKKTEVGIPPLLVKLWDYIRRYVPFLLQYIGDRPPRLSLSGQIFVGYFIFLQLYSFYEWKYACHGMHY